MTDHAHPDVAALRALAEGAWLTYRDEYQRRHYLNSRRAASQMRKREFIAGFMAAGARVEAAEAELRHRELHHFETEQENADLRNRLEAAEAAVARVEALADCDARSRAECAQSDDCTCAYKDCYVCGKWHNCTHTPWVQVRAAIGGDQ